MPRLKNSVKAKYERIGDEKTCFYCDEPPYMDDLTPSQSANSDDIDTFGHPWTITKVCETCWRRIYTANIVRQGTPYGVKKGCMTIEHKRNLLSGTKSNVKGYVVAFDKIVPYGAMKDEEDQIWIRGVPFTMAEIDCLQGALALAWNQRPREDIEFCLSLAYASGKLDLEALNRYEPVVGLE